MYEASSIIIFLQGSFSLLVPLLWHGPWEHAHTHAHTLSLTSPCHCTANDKDPNKIRTPCRLPLSVWGLDGRRASCHHLTVYHMIQAFMSNTFLIMLRWHYYNELVIYKYAPHPVLWLVHQRKRKHPAETVKEERFKSQAFCCECHLRQWRHEVTTAGGAAFWQTQPAIFTSA